MLDIVIFNGASMNSAPFPRIHCRFHGFSPVFMNPVPLLFIQSRIHESSVASLESALLQ